MNENTRAYKIYLVEDDSRIREELSQLLSKYGYKCMCATDFDNAAGNILNSGADLALLDINLPKYDGQYILREIRKSSSVPIIMVTCRDNDMDEYISISQGADDYITKPYNPQILLARIETLLKRAYSGEGLKSIAHKGLTLEIASGTAYADDKSIELTKNEFKILHILMKNAGSVVTRDDLINALWQTDEFIDDNTLTVNVGRLRQKLSDLGLPDYIKTRRAIGYSV